MPGRTFSIAEAAEALRISKEAVRKRLQRESLRGEKGKDGEWIVYLTDDDIPAMSQDTGQDKPAMSQDGQDAVIARLEAQLEGKDAIIAELRNQIESLKHQLDVKTEEARRRDTILLNLQQALPAPKDTRPLWQRILRRGDNTND